MTVISPIPRRKLSHDVLERLLDRINSGEFEPGSLLPSERQLMQSFAVGRPAVREALQHLQRMGLVVITHGEGTRLVRPTAETVLEQIAATVHHILASSNQSLEHLKDARTFFEVGMTRLAAAKATPADVEALNGCIADMEAAGTDFSQFMKYDVAFHRQIAVITGNPIFAAVSEALLVWLSRYHAGLLRKMGREERTLNEHRMIADRIGAHDVEGAAAAMLLHQTRASDLYRPPRRSNSHKR
jgi:DNA-binding FadR family transcriptional regulator